MQALPTTKFSYTESIYSTDVAAILIGDINVIIYSLLLSPRWAKYPTRRGKSVRPYQDRETYLLKFLFKLFGTFGTEIFRLDGVLPMEKAD